MFLCRVAVGEFCLGTPDAPTPDVRDPAKHQLFDSTTDSMNDSSRQMYVTYHDAQAYPEYIIEYSTLS